MGLADRTRLRILNLLLQGQLCGCDIQYVLGVSQSGVSRHLNYLKRAGLVQDRRDGYRVFYRLMAVQPRDSSLLIHYLRLAFAQDKAFRDDLKALRAAIRHGACTVSELHVRTPTTQVVPARRRRVSG
jgi:ArsR family transcriptional regulator